MRSEGRNFQREEGTGTVVNCLLARWLFQIPQGPASFNTQPHLFLGLRWVRLAASKDSPVCAACCADALAFLSPYVSGKCKCIHILLDVLQGIISL